MDIRLGSEVREKGMTGSESHSSVIKNTFRVDEGGIRQGQGHSRSIHRKEVGAAGRGLRFC